ncbi:MAG: hypothetical protein ABJB16_14135 [Saprospiraceae bacterium]
MIEVFKTNIIREEHAKMLLDLIHSAFSHYRANFDLQDCDHILRVECHAGYVESLYLIQLLGSFGIYAEILPDDNTFKIDILDNYPGKYYPLKMKI